MHVSSTYSRSCLKFETTILNVSPAMGIFTCIYDNITHCRQVSLVLRPKHRKAGFWGKRNCSFSSFSSFSLRSGSNLLGTLIKGFTVDLSQCIRVVLGCTCYMLVFPYLAWRTKNSTRESAAWLGIRYSSHFELSWD